VPHPPLDGGAGGGVTADGGWGGHDVAVVGGDHDGVGSGDQEAPDGGTAALGGVGGCGGQLGAAGGVGATGGVGWVDCGSGAEPHHGAAGGVAAGAAGAAGGVSPAGGTVGWDGGAYEVSESGGAQARSGFQC